MVHSESMDYQLPFDVVAGLLAAVTTWQLLNYLARRDDRRRPPPAPALVAAPPPPPIDHTPAFLELIRDTLATMERITTPVLAYPEAQPDRAPVQQPWEILDQADPTDFTPWLSENMTTAYREDTTNVAPDYSTHPMGIPDLQPPSHMAMQYNKLEPPEQFASFRVEHVSN